MVKTVRRHRRDSFAKQVAYIARCQALNPRTGRKHNFAKKGSVEAIGIEGWRGTAEELIAAAVANEPRAKAVEGRMIISALPHEFTARRRLEHARKCATYLRKKFSVAVFWAIHPPSKEGDDRNHHIHFLITSRRVVLERFLTKKTRELDDRKTGGPLIEALRRNWTAMMNAVLEADGHNANLEHRSFKRLGINQVPTKHLGERRTAIARKRCHEEELVPTVFGVVGASRPSLNAPKVPTRIHGKTAALIQGTLDFPGDPRSGIVAPGTDAKPARIPPAKEPPIPESVNPKAPSEAVSPRPQLNAPKVPFVSTMSHEI